MKEIYDKLVYNFAPTIIALFVIMAMLALSAGACIWSIKWLLSVLGVI